MSRAEERDAMARKAAQERSDQQRRADAEALQLRELAREADVAKTVRLRALRLAAERQRDRLAKSIVRRAVKH